jgi:hypothetical protein
MFILSTLISSRDPIPHFQVSPAVQPTESEVAATSSLSADFKIPYCFDSIGKEGSEESGG